MVSGCVTGRFKFRCTVLPPACCYHSSSTGQLHPPTSRGATSCLFRRLQPGVDWATIPSNKQREAATSCLFTRLQAEIEGQPAQKTLKLDEAGCFQEQPYGSLDKLLDRAASSMVADAMSQALAEVAAEGAAAACNDGQGRPDAVLAGSVAAGAAEGVGGAVGAAGRAGGAAGAAPNQGEEEQSSAALAGEAAPEGQAANPCSTWGPAEQRQTVLPGAAETPADSVELLPSGRLAGTTRTSGYHQPSQAQAEIRAAAAAPQEQPATSGSDVTGDSQQTEAVLPQAAEATAAFAEMLPSDQLASLPGHQQPSQGQAEQEPAAQPQEWLATPGAAAPAMQAELMPPHVPEAPAAPETLLSDKLADAEQDTPAAGNASAASVAGQAHEAAAVRSAEGSSSPTAGRGMPPQVQSLGGLLTVCLSCTYGGVPCRIAVFLRRSWQAQQVSK